MQSLSSTLVGPSGGSRIKLVWEFGVSKSPSGFEPAVALAATDRAEVSATDQTKSIPFGRGEVGGRSLSPGAGERAPKPAPDYASIDAGRTGLGASDDRLPSGDAGRKADPCGVGHEGMFSVASSTELIEYPPLGDQPTAARLAATKTFGLA